MYALRLEWNIETIWANNKIFLSNELTGFVVELPSELNHAWPVVCSGNGRVEIARKAGGFGIKNKVHDCSKKGTLNLGISAAAPANC